MIEGLFVIIYTININIPVHSIAKYNLCLCILICLDKDTTYII